MEELFFRHYQAIKARALINDNTTLNDILGKLEEELYEFREAIDFNLTEKFRQETIDVICVLANMLKHMDVDLKTELEKNVITQEIRAGIRPNVSTESLKRVICNLTGIKPDVIFRRNRKREIVEARQLYAYFAWRLRFGTLSVISDLIGGFDHATVLHCVKTIRNLRESNKKIRMYCEQIELKFNIK